MKVKIINKSQHKLPHYATLQSAGMDLRANITESITGMLNKKCAVSAWIACRALCAKLAVSDRTD